MRKFKKIISMVLVAAIISSGIVYQQAEAKDIYFAGKYNHTKYGLYLTMSQYSSPEETEVGDFKLVPGAHVYLKVSGSLNKIKKNVYTYKKGQSVFTFKVYKKKVTVKMNSYAKDNYLDYTGTYKLKKRYARP